MEVNWRDSQSIVKSYLMKYVVDKTAGELCTHAKLLVYSLFSLSFPSNQLLSFLFFSRFPVFCILPVTLESFPTCNFDGNQQEVQCNQDCSHRLARMVPVGSKQWNERCCNYGLPAASCCCINMKQKVKRNWSRKVHLPLWEKGSVIRLLAELSFSTDLTGSIQSCVDADVMFVDASFHFCGPDED